MQDTLGWCEEQQCLGVSNPPQCPALPAHLLAVAGGDVWGTRFLAQWLNDGHLGKVLHRLLELRQGPAAIAFAAFDVLGLSFWGRTCEIQEQSVWVTRVLQIRLPGHSTQGWFGRSISSAESPPPLCPDRCQLLSGTNTLTVASGLRGWHWSCSRKTKTTPWNQGFIFLTLGFPD